MRIAILGDDRPAVVADDGQTLRPVRRSGRWNQDTDLLSASWWVRMCGDPNTVPQAEELDEPIATASAFLRAPVLNPSKIIACASNYSAHVAEMKETVLPRTSTDAPAWLLDFDVFLKAPSSIIGPCDAVQLPPTATAANVEVHHESELAIVIGRGGRNITADDALTHIFGYVPSLDMTLRGNGDRSRRKSYDTFTPVGPWVTTYDEISDPHALDIKLTVNGTVRQDVNTAAMTVRIPDIIEYVSAVMTLNPGDLILTGAPPGVGPVHAGDVMNVHITQLGRLQIPVQAQPAP